MFAEFAIGTERSELALTKPCQQHQRPHHCTACNAPERIQFRASSLMRLDNGIHHCDDVASDGNNGQFCDDVANDGNNGQFGNVGQGDGSGGLASAISF